ncbi:MAG: primosomal protein N' [Defluviitaleaceae bacterium]|nr:primosomal protein N' [Defluviitaleaceae bacterium]
MPDFFFASVCVDILHGDVDRLFSYKIPPTLEVSPGWRVRVPFGRGDSIKIGYVTEVFADLPPDSADISKIKEIHSTLDDFPVLTPETIALAFWMQKKYYTTLAACIRAIIPGAKSDGRFPTARRKPPVAEAIPADVTLTPEQTHAVSQINKSINAGGQPPILLHGVTGSGKTEVYLHAIENILSAGKQAIVLVPEIALTPQMVALFSARFGSAVAVTHSRLTQAERFQIWKMALTSRASLVIGPRSAVFAPFPNLGLIVIDEEHEHSYHSDTSPKYDAREVALKRGELSGATVVLGSATPSLESYFKTLGTPPPIPPQGDNVPLTPIEKPREARFLGKNSDESSTPGPETVRSAVSEKSFEGARGNFFKSSPVSRYKLVKLSERINKTLPEIHIVDMRHEMRRGNTSVFSAEFQSALGETIAAGRQAILFLNRRGYSSFVSCRWCGHVMGCESCRVNHTYHADKGRLLCHYCGKGLALPKKCPVCESEHIKKYGTGTQKVEEEICELFPAVKVLRMDMDTTRGKFGHAKILDAFRAGDAQILIGTQMVAKGLDFPNVTLVGVIAADMSLHTGDFRAGEHTFQLLTQVAGRAGRAGFSGKVFIQTYNPEHYAVVLAEKSDYEKFFEHEIALRHAMVYPPFSHVFSVMITGTNERDVIDALQTLCAIMEYVNQRDGKARFEIIGLSPAFVSMIKKRFRWKLLVKSPEEAPLVAFVLYCINKMKQSDGLKNMTLHLTLNPIMME